jgi:hypothetical protein
MGLLSFIYLLLKSPRSARRPTVARKARQPAQRQFSGEFFDAASHHCKLQPVRSGILKDRRR